MADTASGSSRRLARTPVSVRYTLMAKAMQWVTILLIMAFVPVAWVVMSLPDGPQQSWLFVIKMSLSVTILAVVAARLAWRAMHPPPPPGIGPLALEYVGRTGCCMPCWC